MTETPEPTRSEFLAFGAPLIGEEEIQEVVATLRSGWLGTGPRTHQFESDFCEYIGCQYAVALNSCTAGLHLALKILGIGPGDEVITTPLTFCSTANVIVHCGATPVFVDIDRETVNIDPNLIKDKITEKTKAIIPVHFAGRPCDMDAIMDIAQRHGLAVVEDAAHAIEAEYKGEKVGNIGDMTCFSFYVTKNLVTGEGGMLTTNNQEWAEKAKILRLHGLSRDAWKRYSEEGSKPYDVLYPGYKYNMMDLQAALGIHQLRRIEDNLVLRGKQWNRYNEAFREIPGIVTPIDQDHIKHARHLYTILIEPEISGMARNEFIDALKQEKIGASIHFIALHLHSYYAQNYGLKRGDFPNAEYISDRTVSLPFSAKLSEKDVDDVINAVKKLSNRNRG